MLTRWRKTRLRKRAAAARAEAFRRAPEAGAMLAKNFPDQAWPPLRSMVAGYRAVRDEIDPAPLMETFMLEQARLCLPCTGGEGQPLVFRSWTPGDDLLKRSFGVEEPGAGAPEARPALVLVPLLAFDEQGRRIGYGEGYYDRTLEALRAHGPVTAVGLAYEAQKVSKVPTGRHDQRLDWIVTEKRAYRGRA
ncbi:5-formyltetrahydrofolate cyclo-ligase [Glycocaulis profundi]|nr:5-formyltetrahydrofolate cyclo-ligase [Glycocaulis profundi]